MDSRFEAFGTSHVVMLVLFVVAIPVVVWWGRRVRGTGGEERSRRIVAVGIVATALPLQVLQLLPSDWDFATSLPLQLCDLAWMVAVVGLWTRAPWAAALTYYWGLTLTTQAMLTPALVQDFPHPRYIGFWVMHLLVVWAAIYLTVGLGIRPTWRLYALTVGLTSVWVTVVMTFNTVVDTNYGYLNAKPGTGSALDLLGPWPWYVVIEVVVVAAVWALITLPWTRTGVGHLDLPRGAEDPSSLRR
ncbi:hypothetical protein GCM10009623_06970 [Nocardioides aestuarii]|uniref:TIGR02206 family membrane protein n=1 Tax=Nocardioides aestuarii TaxID=252231 RepID=A0ABW4TI81_9ACTN